MTTTQPFDNHLLALWADQSLDTPAFVYDVSAIQANLEKLAVTGQHPGCHLIYSIKALSYQAVLEIIRPYVSGFSTSSLFECRLAREIAGPEKSVHLTSPGLRVQEMQEIRNYCDYISFNSLSQWQQYRQWANGMQCGLRINPGISFARDARYDPCRPHSKLGVPLAQLPAVDDPVWSEGITGLHIHNNCESVEYGELMRTVEQLVVQAPGLLERMSWLNLGGGYLLSTTEQLSALSGFIQSVSSEYNLQLFFEPGKAIVGNAGYLAASVVDVFDSSDMAIAILDTTVNHLPEVFEYQYQPSILQEQPDGKYTYRLAGASCLSGDIFGDYCFDRPLEPGNRIIFRNVGAYTMVKANMFNGINLPTVYCVNEAGKLVLQKKHSYDDYRYRL